MIIMSNHQSESTEAQHSAAEAINDANDDIEEALGDVWWRKPAQISAMVSNFSTSYNVVNISIALPILRYLYKGSEEDEAACSSSLLAGMIVGQIIGGALGDSFLGRLGALRLVMSIQIVASLGSAVMLWGEYLYIGLAIWRFILGIGAGAVYPLAATLSAEQAENDHPQQDQELSPDEKVAQVKSVVLTFSMQGVGFLAVSLISVSLLYLMPESSLDAVWRILLGLGSLPGLVLIILQLRMYRRGDSEILPQEESDDMVSNTIMEQRQEPLIAREGEVTAEPNVDEIAELHASHGICTRIRREPNLCQKLVGTACTWFLFDVLFYGNTLFQPVVMEAAFVSNASDEYTVIRKAALDSLFLTLIALPGYAISALVIGKRLCNILQTPRYVQMQGFVAMGLLYSVIGAYWGYLKRIPPLLVAIYGLTFFFANYGPNTTTFIFPSLVFSRECRSTLNGISAAAGKAGALVGATLFEPASDHLGDNIVMLICAAVSVFAFALTNRFTKVPMSGQS